MAKLLIKTLYRSVWSIFGFQHQAAVEERNCFRSEIEESLGQETASAIQCHVDTALGRIKADELPTPQIMAMPEFFQLLAAELSVREVGERIEAGSVFRDPDDGLLPTLGLSWKDDVLPLIDGQKSPGYLSVQNVEKFLAMVRDTEGSAEEISDDFRGKRQELIGFLEKAAKLGEPIWCEM